VKFSYGRLLKMYNTLLRITRKKNKIAKNRKMEKQNRPRKILANAPNLGQKK